MTLLRNHIVINAILITAAAAQVKTYVNEKYAYRVDYPSAELIAKGEADAGDGQRFVSTDGKITVLVWGQFDVLDETLASKLAAALKRDKLAANDPKVYKVQKPGWYVYSGVKGAAMIVYEKTFLTDGVFKNLRFEYPVAERTRGDAIVKSMAASFQDLH